MKKRTSILSLAAVVVVVVLAGLLAVNGLTIGDEFNNIRINSVGENIRLGLDLRGGVYAVYVAPDPGQEDFDTLMDGTIAVLRDRLTGQGFTEAAVSRQGSDRIRVEIPDVESPEDILDIIGTPARLEFKDPEGNVVLVGADIKKAYAGIPDGTTEPVVFFELNDSGREAFAAATADNIGRAISIHLDGEVISAPTVENAITGGEGIITGMAGAEEARELAMLIMSGALPLDIQQDEVNMVSAILGEEALDTSLKAGVIGLTLVMLFMLILYRLPGLMANLALCVYVLIVAYALAIARVQLTLPGIAGILLGIGMAVDANVIIFERFREELQGGCRLPVAVRRGFQNAITAVIDSNVTTIIAALVLMYFGTGPIKGFAITLFIGVVASMFTAVSVTRWLLTCAVALKPDGDLKLYSRPFKNREPSGFFTRYTKIFGGISALILAAAIVLSLCGMGMDMGIDFTGGSMLCYEMRQDFETAEVEAALAELGVAGANIAKTGEKGNMTQLQIEIKSMEDGEALRGQIREALSRKYPNMSFTSIGQIGARAGQDLIENAVKSLLIVFALMLLYIAIRFDWRSGLAALAALAHDVLVMCAFMVFFRGAFQVNSPFIAGLLTIVGYSINNTIVVFDRIREMAKYTQYMDRPRAEIVDVAVSHTMSRTLNTTFTTLLTLVCLFVLGVASIREFSFPLLVGLLAGTYSSVLLSGQMWAFWQDWARARKKAPTGKKKK